MSALDAEQAEHRIEMPLVNEEDLKTLESTAVADEGLESKGQESPTKCDRYGFLQEDRRWTAVDDNIKTQRKNLIKERDRTTKWVKMIKSWDRYVHLKPEKLKRRIRKGIPDALRGAVWPLLINVQLWRAKYPTAMDPALMATVSDHVRDDITKDINRTYPRHELFSNAGFGQESLERILVLYAAHDPAANYCQGMGFIAGMFLMYMDEETALYCMIGALEVSNIMRPFITIHFIFSSYMPLRIQSTH